MLILLANDNLEVSLGASHTTNALPVIASYRDADAAAGTLVLGRNTAATNGTTPVTAVAAPSGSVQRLIDTLSIYNHDTVSHTVTVTYDNNGTDRIAGKWNLAPGDILQYSKESGWSRDASTVTPSGYQPIKAYAVHADSGVAFAMTYATNAERFAGNTTRHIFSVDLSGYTQVRMTANVQVASASVNTPLFRAKYNTAWSATVGSYSQLGLSGQVQVSVAAATYVDTGWVDLATLARVDGCFIGFTEIGGDGAADPALGATDILFR